MAFSNANANIFTHLLPRISNLNLQMARIYESYYLKKYVKAWQFINGSQFIGFVELSHGKEPLIRYTSKE